MPFMSILQNALQAMSKTRPWFYSEADFQHCLALELHNQGCSNVYLEFPEILYLPHFKSGSSGTMITVSPMKECHIDIIAEYNGLLHPIELKYKTKSVSVTNVFGDSIALPNHAAHPINRFLYWQDVQRLEIMTAGGEAHKYAEGYALFLTNDPLYWSGPNSTKTIDYHFRINTGASLVSKKVEWHKATPKVSVTADGYKSGKLMYNNFLLSGSYSNFNWIIYSNSVAPSKYTFKYLLVTV